ncbi:MAG: Rid family hydrolase [Phycisphaerae bacterium]|jgi:enamine deaminase RidA (YjgF/YER057c/UK114 family)
MTVNFDTRSVGSPEATEIYIAAVPKRNAPPQTQAEEIFSGIGKILRSKSAYILQERIFAAGSAMETVRSVRSKEYGDIDDGVAPTFLVGKEGSSGPISGVQVHAVTGSKPEVLKLDNKPCGRIFRTKDRAYLTLSDISAPKIAEANKQARVMLEKAESILKKSGADFLSVPRTWMWLGDILSWYDDFNQVRNKFFIERGLIGSGSRQSMPASTGIGLGPITGESCTMDLTAVLKPADSIEFLEAVGKQQCAFEYGSAFSRASRAITPAGETVFISGTASIDAAGATTNLDDARGQINETIENVRAVLGDMNCADKDVVQVMAYCKTTEVEKIFTEAKASLAWPWVTVICDICRADLLFEIEAAAMPRK